MPDNPNILLIAIDSIRADHMSCYGYERLTTPHIDRLRSIRRPLRKYLQPTHPDDARLRVHAHRAGLFWHPGGGAATSGSAAAGSADRG